MKHLKKYNESVSEISLQDVEDICQELKDEGFQIYNIITHQSYNNKKLYIIEISRKGGFKYDDVKETLLRLKDYLGSSWIFGLLKRRWDIKYSIATFDMNDILVYSAERDILHKIGTNPIYEINIYINV